MSFAEIASDSDEDETTSMTEDSKTSTVEKLVSSSSMPKNSGDVRKSVEGSPKSRRTLAPQWSRSGNQGAAPLRLNATKPVGPSQGNNGFRGALAGGDGGRGGWSETGGQRSERKKIQRFTPQELVAMYKPSDFKPPLRDLETLLTSQSQPPLSLAPMDQEQVRAKWEAHYANRQSVKRGSGGRVNGSQSSNHRGVVNHGNNSTGVAFILPHQVDLTSTWKHVDLLKGKIVLVVVQVIVVVVIVGIVIVDVKADPTKIKVHGGEDYVFPIQQHHRRKSLHPNHPQEMHKIHVELVLVY